LIIGEVKMVGELH
jgi:hypothetical protein